MIEAGEFIEPKRIPADHKVKAVVPDGMDPTMLRDIMQDYANFLASKGCTFFQADVNDNNTILIMSGWLQQPGLPDLPYVDRSELEPPKVTKLSVVERN